MRGFDTLLIGGGVIGCSLARLLASAGERVGIVEKGAPGQEASSAAAGMLSPSAEAEQESPLFDLCRASLALYPSWVRDLQSETGIDVRYRTEGTLLVFSSESERQLLAGSLSWQRRQGVEMEELSAAQLRDCESHLASFAGAFYLPGDHQVDNRRLIHALVQSCRSHEVEFILGQPVRSIERDGDRVAGVIVGEGAPQRIFAARVLNTAGAWASQIETGSSPAPIRPVKGQIVALESPETVLRHVARNEHVYLVPRENGRVLVGSTMEEAGFDKTPRAAAVARLITAAQKLCPPLEQAAIAEVWAGLRPAAPDCLPILGPAKLENYWFATGHFRNGILLAPVTAEIVSSWILKRQPRPEAEPFLARRFNL
jgi:glycine oxidase